MFEDLISPVRKAISKIEDLPIVSKLSPSGARSHSVVEKSGYLCSQDLAQRCAREVAKLIQPGWSEKETARTMEIWLKDHGVQSFFHKPFVWFGDRTRFAGVRNYRDYQATNRRLQEGEIFILDVAPMVEGYISDIGFSGIIGENHDFDAGLQFLESLRQDIPGLVTTLNNGAAIWRAIDKKITDAGYQNIHSMYPFGVLGHRVHRSNGRWDISFLNFGWQSYWEFTSRGIFGQLLDADYQGSMEGLWAIEPHIGGGNFGMKFEEILVVEGGQASWLSNDSIWSLKRPMPIQSSKGKS